MNVAHISQPWPFAGPPVHEGSVEIVAHQLAVHLAPRCNVSIYALRGQGQGAGEWYQRVRYHRVAGQPDEWVFRPLRLLARAQARAMPGRPRFASLAGVLGYGLQVAIDLRARRTDIIHIHNYAQLAPLMRALNPQARIVLHMHCEWLTQLDYAMVARRLARTDLIISPSERLTGMIRARFPQYAERCCTVYNGVDVEHFASAAAGGAGGQGGPRIFCVARFSPEKGLHILIDAFKLVSERFPDATLEIAGRHASQLPRALLFALSDQGTRAELAPFYDRDTGDNYFRHLERQVRRLGLTERVSFPGYVPHHAIVRRYHAADLLVFPSVWPEAFGLPIVEAMAAGVPVVATRLGAFPELIEDGTSGLLVERGSPGALAEAITRLLGDQGLRARMRSAASQHVRAQFAWPVVAERLLGHYRRLCAANTRPARAARAAIRRG